MPEKPLPIIISAHHDADVFPGEYADRTALTPFQQKHFSDYGSAETAPKIGVLNLQSKVSRGLVDLNRSPEDPTLYREQDFEGNNIWKPGQEPTAEERKKIKKLFYDTYHQQILHTIQNFSQPGLVIAWDNAAHKIIGENEQGEPTMMTPFILSNRGDEGSAGSNAGTTSCDPALLEEMAQQLTQALKKYDFPTQIEFNLVFKGGYISEHYNTRRHPDEMPTEHEVQSFQIEYDTSLTHDQETLEPNLEKMNQLREVFETAITDTYSNYYRE